MHNLTNTSHSLFYHWFFDLALEEKDGVNSKDGGEQDQDEFLETLSLSHVMGSIAAHKGQPWDITFGLLWQLLISSWKQLELSIKNLQLNQHNKSTQLSNFWRGRIFIVGALLQRYSQ